MANTVFLTQYPNRGWDIQVDLTGLRAIVKTGDYTELVFVEGPPVKVNECHNEIVEYLEGWRPLIGQD